MAFVLLASGWLLYFQASQPWSRQNDRRVIKVMSLLVLSFPFGKPQFSEWFNPLHFCLYIMAMTISFRGFYKDEYLSQVNSHSEQSKISVTKKGVRLRWVLRMPIVRIPTSPRRLWLSHSQLHLCYFFGFYRDVSLQP